MRHGLAPSSVASDRHEPSERVIGSSVTDRACGTLARRRLVENLNVECVKAKR